MAKKRLSVNDRQKQAIKLLFMPGNYMVIWSSGYRIFGKRRTPLLKVNIQTGQNIKRFMREKKQPWGRSFYRKWILDRRLIRGLRKNCWVKQYYLTTIPENERGL